MTGVGLSMPQLGAHVNRTVLESFATRAETRGFDSLWVQDHMFYPYSVEQPYAGQPGLAVPPQFRQILAPTETLAAVSAWTDRVTIGTSVLVAGYHRPVDIAKRLATIDVLSEGRLVAGFGIGWSKEEHTQMDVDFHTRGRRCDEFIEAVLACWSEDPVEFSGDFFQIPKSDILPKPMRKPPLLSGMFSTVGRLRAARMFDIWNPVGPLESVLEQARQMQQTRAVDRDPLQTYWRIAMDDVDGNREHKLNFALEKVADDIAAARRAGVDHVIIDANLWSYLDSADDWTKLPDAIADSAQIS